MSTEKKLALPIGEKQEAYRLALAGESEMFQQLAELEHTSNKLRGLLDAAHADRDAAEAAKTALEGVIRQAAVQGSPIDSKNRKELAAFSESIAECLLRVEALNDEIANLETAKRQINDEIMSGRRWLSWLKADAQREAAIAFLQAMLSTLPDGVTLKSIAERLKCAEHRLAEFAAH
jgi:hypothetical protein